MNRSGLSVRSVEVEIPGDLAPGPLRYLEGALACPQHVLDREAGRGPDDSGIVPRRSAPQPPAGRYPAGPRGCGRRARASSARLRGRLRQAEAHALEANVLMPPHPREIVEDARLARRSTARSMPPAISRFSQSLMRPGLASTRGAKGRGRANARGKPVTAYADLAHARSRGALGAAPLHNRHVAVFQHPVARWRAYRTTQGRRELGAVDHAYYSQRIGRARCESDQEDIARALYAGGGRDVRTGLPQEWRGFYCVDSGRVDGRAAMPLADHIEAETGWRSAWPLREPRSSCQTTSK